VISYERENYFHYSHLGLMLESTLNYPLIKKPFQ
jgi:hypothetical protein